MDSQPFPEREGNYSMRNFRLQTYALDPPLESRSPSESSESDPLGPSVSSDLTNATSITSDSGTESTGIATVSRKRRRDTFLDALPVPKRRTNAVLEEEPLCDYCQQIEFQKVLDADVLSLQKERNGILLADLGTRCNNPSTASTCPLCHLFYQSRVQHKTSSEYQLRIYSYLRSTKAIAFGLSRERHRATDIPCLGVVPSKMEGKTFRLHADAVGHLFCLKGDAYGHSLFKPWIPQQSAALSQVKEWLDFCSSQHSPCQNRESQVAGLKLLDCETYDVVPAPANANYAALSYVWGTTVNHSEMPATEYSSTHNLDPRITKTIRDAAAAAKRLGYKYLWVDKLCIDQGNAEEKHHQISQMDSIYGSADMTIIAACGQDCHYGLPGVNGTPRALRRSVKAGQIHVFSPTRHPHHSIQSSKWITRGWTLQEACLSTRRLVIVDNQLYFECNTMHCSETVAPNLDLIHDPKGNIYPCFQSGMLSINMGRRFAGAVPRDTYEQQRLYVNLVAQYTKRTLTFESDRPKAFAGIIRHFAKKTFFELWGIPYGMGSPNIIHEHFISGLLWAHRNPLEQVRHISSGEDAFIDVSPNLQALASIPSWSWMGWRGEISFPQSSLLVDNMVHDIRLELGSDSWIKLHHLLSAASESSARVLSSHITPPKILLLDVDCVKISDISLHSADNLKIYGREAHWYISRGPIQPKLLYKLLLSEKLQLLLLAWNFSTEKVYLMIVENHGGFTSRVGIGISQATFYPKPTGQRKWIRVV